MENQENVPGKKRIRITWKQGLLFGIVIFAAILSVLSLFTGVTPENLPLYLADQARITNNNQNVKAAIEGYASYQSVPDQIWRARSVRQNITLALPERVTKKMSVKGGTRTVSGKNPVMAAPHLYIDLDHDGKFSESECVYNRMKKDQQGNVTDYGKFLTPGHELRTVKLNRSIPAGSYDGQLLWTGLLIRNHEVANPMAFRFHVTVK